MDSISSPFLDPNAAAFYKESMQVLTAEHIPFLVGGAYALNCYAGVERHTKDLDIFIRESDCHRALELLSKAGFRTEMTDIRWIAKAFHESYYVDFIFGSANCIAMVDEQWFEYSMPGEVLKTPVLLVPAEEMIWSKAFVMDRDRFDGADIVHVFHRCGPHLNWKRLIERFSDQWHVLLMYCIYFQFIYPAERTMIPDWVLFDLLSRFETEVVNPPPDKHVCRGGLFSTTQYLIDFEKWGYSDAKVQFVKKRFNQPFDQDAA